MFAVQKKSNALDHSLHKKTLSTKVTTMLGTSKNILNPGHNHLLTTGADDLTLRLYIYLK